MQFELLPPVPAVVVAKELRQIPLFGFVSVDELFRFSSITRQVRHSQGSTLQREGAPAEYIQVLVEGRARVLGAHRNEEVLEPPSLFGFREVLEGTAYQETATAEATSICLALEAGEFRTMLSDNIDMAQGLFRMLLSLPSDDAPPGILKGVAAKAVGGLPSGLEEMRPIDKALLVREIPVFSKAGAEEALGLSNTVQEVALEKNATLFTEGDSASIWIILAGEVILEPPKEGGANPIVVTAGDVVGVEETLGGRHLSWRARVERETRALKMERELLFDALADRMDLLQGLFRSLFQTKNDTKKGVP